MYLLNRFCHSASLFGGTLLLCFTLAAGADELQDINKLFKQGQHEQAMQRINVYLEDKPKDAQARFLKGLILTDQGKTSDAIRIFSELTEDYPELPEPYNNLAVLYASQGQYDKAKTSLEMAIRAHPNYATAHENLGDIYAKMAGQAYDRALQLDRGNTITQTKLALIKELLTTGAAKGGKPGKTTPSDATKSPPAAAAITAEAPAPTPGKISAAPASDAPTPRNTPSAATGHAAVEKPAAASSGNEVLKAVKEWAAAWSSKNVKHYLAFYAEDFKTPDGKSRSKWEAQRTERISKSKTFHVDISNPKVKLIDASHASVSFKQAFSASHKKTTSSKTLVLVKSGGNWLIQEERSGK